MGSKVAKRYEVCRRGRSRIACYFPSAPCGRSDGLWATLGGVLFRWALP